MFPVGRRVPASKQVHSANWGDRISQTFWVVVVTSGSLTWIFPVEKMFWFFFANSDIPWMQTKANFCSHSVSVCQSWSWWLPALRVLDVSLFQHTSFKWSAHHEPLLKPDNDPFIWTTCVGAGFKNTAWCNSFDGRCNMFFGHKGNYDGAISHFWMRVKERRPRFHVWVTHSQQHTEKRPSLFLITF